jgi:glucose-6-phosphate 1-dehydrogenase
MDELSELRQQVAALQLQNTQLMGLLKDQAPCPLPKHSPADQDGNNTQGSYNVGVMVLGASGDLAKKKTFPALFHLYRNKLIPESVVIMGYSRTKMSRESFHKRITGFVKGFEEEWKQFLTRCWYHDGAYDSAEDMKAAAKAMEDLHVEQAGLEADAKIDRIFYMALPPTVFVDAAKAVKAGGMSKNGWNRIIVEKPFGHDLASSNAMNADLSRLFTEAQLYRIDHYLGKEIVQNLMALRFANSAFEPIWSNKYISNVRITFRENFGCEGRAGYFDQSGIIRDVLQNHLLQTMALIAMESPVTLLAEDVRNEKVKVLRAVLPLVLEDLVVGQYGKDKDGTVPAYLEEEGVAKDSITPTFATTVLHINNARWEGVPFILKAGKGLNERKVDIRIQFKTVGTHLFPSTASNELVFIIQPNEAIYFKIMNKVPGLTNEVAQSELDLTYKSRFNPTHTPDAYERLILDVFRGDHNLFVRADELEAAWKIFTPALHQLEEKRIKPVTYTFGSRGPAESDQLAERYGFKRFDGYTWNAPGSSAPTK